MLWAERRTPEHVLAVAEMTALGAVITLSALTPLWPAWAYPAAGVLAAAQGSRLATALDRADHRPLRVVLRRVAGLLPAVWLAGPAVFWLQSAPEQSAPERAAVERIAAAWREPSFLLTWVVPLSEPHAGDPGHSDLAGRIWLVRALLWLVIAAPALAFCGRRWGRRTAAGILALIAATAAGLLWARPGPAASFGLSVTVLAGPWLLGVAHHDRRLHIWRLSRVLPAALALIAAGGWYFASRPVELLEDQSASPRGLGACAALMLGFVLLLLRGLPLRARVPRRSVLAGRNAVSAAARLLATRAVTLYLWSGPCGALARRLPEWGPADPSAWPPELRAVLEVAVTWAAVLLVASGLGWAEDVGAGRRPRLVPAGSGPVPRAATSRAGRAA